MIYHYTRIIVLGLSISIAGVMFGAAAYSAVKPALTGTIIPHTSDSETFEKPIINAMKKADDLAFNPFSSKSNSITAESKRVGSINVGDIYSINGSVGDVRHYRILAVRPLERHNNQLHLSTSKSFVYTIPQYSHIGLLIVEGEHPYLYMVEELSYGLLL